MPELFADRGSSQWPTERDDWTGRVLLSAPATVARRLGLVTVLVSRVDQHGTWRPWSAVGIDSEHAADLAAWRETGTGDPARLSDEDDIDQLVRRCLARNWIMAPIYRAGLLVGFLHADDRRVSSAPFFRACNQDLWIQLFAAADELFEPRRWR